MSKDYLLGIDIGTSACKVAIFNKNGKVMASAMGITLFIILMRDGRSRSRMNGGMRFAALFANAWRQVIFQESRLPEWELMGRAGRLLPLTMREMF